MNQQIQELIKLSKEELLDELIKKAEAAREWAESGEEEENLKQIENIIYTLRNCQYKGRE